MKSEDFVTPAELRALLSRDGEWLIRAKAVFTPEVNKSRTDAIGPGPARESAEDGAELVQALQVQVAVLTARVERLERQLAAVSSDGGAAAGPTVCGAAEAAVGCAEAEQAIAVGPEELAEQAASGLSALEQAEVETEAVETVMLHEWAADMLEQHEPLAIEEWLEEASVWAELDSVRVAQWAAAETAEELQAEPLQDQAEPAKDEAEAEFDRAAAGDEEAPAVAEEASAVGESASRDGAADNHTADELAGEQGEPEAQPHHVDTAMWGLAEAEAFEAEPALEQAEPGAYEADALAEDTESTAYDAAGLDDWPLAKLEAQDIAELGGAWTEAADGGLEPGAAGEGEAAAGLATGSVAEAEQELAEAAWEPVGESELEAEWAYAQEANELEGWETEAVEGVPACVLDEVLADEAAQPTGWMEVEPRTAGLVEAELEADAASAAVSEAADEVDAERESVAEAEHDAELPAVRSADEAESEHTSEEQAEHQVAYSASEAEGESSPEQAAPATASPDSDTALAAAGGAPGVRPYSSPTLQSEWATVAAAALAPPPASEPLPVTLTPFGSAPPPQPNKRPAPPVERHVVTLPPVRTAPPAAATLAPAAAKAAPPAAPGIGYSRAEKFSKQKKSLFKRLFS